MNILIINHYSGSSELGMGYRHYYLARELQALGHDVRIVASRFSHLRLRQPQFPAKTWTDHGGVPHLWLAGCSYRGNGIQRVLNMMGFAASLWRNAPLIARQHRPDVVLASSPHPFSAYGAARLARLANANFIFEIRDLWPLSLTELGAISPRHPLMRMFDHAEAYGCRHANKVISLLPCVDEYMQQRGVARDKWVSIPNGILPDEWQASASGMPDQGLELLAMLRAQGKFIVGYAGAHGVPNALDTFLDAARLLDGEKVAIVLVGDGSEKASLQQRARAEAINNIHFLDQVKKDQIPAILQWFDVAYIGWHRHPVYRFGIAPNKLMDYMMAARPVLHAVEAGNDAVAEAGCGLSVSPGDPHAVAQGIRQFLSLSPEERKAMGQRGREFVLKNHTYPMLAQRFLGTCI